LEKENRRGKKLSHPELANQRQRRKAEYFSEKEWAAPVTHGEFNYTIANRDRRVD
jgi:hypothetical protein